MDNIVEVQLGEYRRITPYQSNDIECDRDNIVILDTSEGSEFGRVTTNRSIACKGKLGNTQGKILRKATEGDLKQIENNRLKAIDAQNTCLRRIAEADIDMRLVKSEYTFDSSKIIFFFTTSGGRVDFRNLVKDLAKVFRVRIELKQIGVRDKAKVVGGYGVCGRELCCTSYMRDFNQTGMKMAKDQSLPLNPSRVHGLCDRVKCCMAYEYGIYREYAKGLPRIGDKVDTEEGKGRVVDLNILRSIVRVDLGEGKIIKLNYAQAPQPALAAASDERSSNGE